VKQRLMRIELEFGVEWDEKARAEWGGRDPDEIDVQRRVMYSVLCHRNNMESKDGMKINSVEIYQDSFYRHGHAHPAHYICSKCGVHGVKLWRQYNTCADSLDLLCGQCALEDQDEKGPINSEGNRQGEHGETCQIGWLVPAVPTEDGSTYWGYTSIPASGVRWWRALPTTKDQ